MRDGLRLVSFGIYDSSLLGGWSVLRLLLLLLRLRWGFGHVGVVISVVVGHPGVVWETGREEGSLVVGGGDRHWKGRGRDGFRRGREVRIVCTSMLGRGGSRAGRRSRCDRGEGSCGHGRSERRRTFPSSSESSRSTETAEFAASPFPSARRSRWRYESVHCGRSLGGRVGRGSVGEGQTREVRELERLATTVGESWRDRSSWRFSMGRLRVFLRRRSAGMMAVRGGRGGLSISHRREGTGRARKGRGDGGRRETSERERVGGEGPIALSKVQKRDKREGAKIPAISIG